MTSFALGFMLVSMTAVTALAGYCLFRILRVPSPSAPPDGDDD